MSSCECEFSCDLILFIFSESRKYVIIFVTQYILVLCLRPLSHPLLISNNTCTFFISPVHYPVFSPWLLFFYPLLSVNFSHISANDNIRTHSSGTSNLSSFLICFTFQSVLPAVTFLGDQTMWQYLCNSISCFVYYLLSKRCSSLITQMFFVPNEFYLC